MSLGTPAQSIVETEASSQIAFANFADAATRRYVAPPLILSLALSGAVIASFLGLAIPLDGELGAKLQPLVERFFGNGFSRTILILFLSAAVYGALQMIGVAIDRSRLRSMGRSGGLRGRFSWLACLVGRPGETEWVGGWMGAPHDFAHRYSVQRQHYVELGMLPLRFAAWVLPLLGFLGTVVGVASSIGGLEIVISAGPGNKPTDGLRAVLGGLTFAFDTTLLGLVAVIPVMVLQMFLGGRESVVTEEGRHRVLALLAKGEPEDGSEALPEPSSDLPRLAGD